jgi:hypothetical protein
MDLSLQKPRKKMSDSPVLCKRPREEFPEFDIFLSIECGSYVKALEKTMKFDGLFVDVKDGVLWRLCASADHWLRPDPDKEYAVLEELFEAASRKTTPEVFSCLDGDFNPLSTATDIGRLDILTLFEKYGCLTRERIELAIEFAKEEHHQHLVDQSPEGIEKAREASRAGIRALTYARARLNWRALVPRARSVGKIASFVRHLYTEVQFRPGGAGYFASFASFDRSSKKCGKSAGQK